MTLKEDVEKDLNELEKDLEEILKSGKTINDVSKSLNFLKYSGYAIVLGTTIDNFFSVFQGKSAWQYVKSDIPLVASLGVNLLFCLGGVWNIYREKYKKSLYHLADIYRETDDVNKHN